MSKKKKKTASVYEEEADGIMEQRKSHVCLTAVMDNSPILGKITHDCRMMIYK